MHYHYLYVLGGMLGGVLFQYLFSRRKIKDDWRVVWSRSEEIPIIYPDYSYQKGVEWVTIEIWFSRSRRRYRFDFLGGINRCKARQMYQDAIQEMNRLENGGHLGTSGYSVNYTGYTAPSRHTGPTGYFPHKDANTY